MFWFQTLRFFHSFSFLGVHICGRRRQLLLVLLNRAIVSLLTIVTMMINRVDV